MCAGNTESCVAAALAGAQRVELCSALHLGGLTPSPGTIRRARAVCRARGLSLSVLVRPREGDFVYSPGEFDEILGDIAFCRDEAVDFVSCGFLLPDGHVDSSRLGIAVQAAAPMQCIFHRAFDNCADMLHSLNVIIQCGCAAVLTSGGARTALEGRSMLSQLVQAAAGRISVVAAAGVNASTAVEVVEACTSPCMLLPVDAPPVWIHMSGSALIPTAADPSLPCSGRVNFTGDAPPYGFRRQTQESAVAATVALFERNDERGAVQVDGSTCGVLVQVLACAGASALLPNFVEAEFNDNDVKLLQERQLKLLGLNPQQIAAFLAAAAAI